MSFQDNSSSKHYFDSTNYFTNTKSKKIIKGTGHFSFQPLPGNDEDKNYIFQSISYMSQYNCKSFEELKWEDYQFKGKLLQFNKKLVFSTQNFNDLLLIHSHLFNNNYQKRIISFL